MDEALLRRLAVEQDRRDIEEVVKLYLAASDRRKPELMEQVFGAEGKQWIAGRQVRGPGASPDPLSPAEMGLPGAPIATSHCLHQCLIELAGDVAHGEIYTVNYVIVEGEPRRIFVRGVRCLDRYVRREVGWRIAERRNCLDWSYEQPAAMAITWGERVSFDGLAP